MRYGLAVQLGDLGAAYDFAFPKYKESRAILFELAEQPSLHVGSLHHHANNVYLGMLARKLSGVIPSCAFGRRRARLAAQFYAL